MKTHTIKFSLYDPGIPVAVWHVRVGKEDWYFEAAENSRLEVLVSEWLEVVK